MLCAFIFAIACATYAQAQDEGVIVPDDKVQCINQMVQWCDNMQYPQQGAGLSVLSLTYEDPNGFYRIFCSSDADGTNCTKNRNPWFSCNPDHVLTYKGQVLTNSSTDIDDDICKTADKAFNELFIQNLSYDNTTLQDEVQKGMEAFFEQMAAMEEQIALIQKMLRRIPGINSFLGDFDDMFRSPNSTPALPSDTPIITDQSNQIEKE